MRTTFLSLIVGLISSTGFGAGTQNFRYPELHTVPKATATLGRAAKSEKKEALTQYLSVQAGAMASLLVGYRASQVTELVDGAETPSPASVLGYTAMGAGASVLAFTALLSAVSTPYRDGLKSVNAVKGTTKAAALERERLAEAALESAATLDRRVVWASSLLNGVLLAAIAGEANDDYLRATAALGAAIAFAPLFFDTKAMRIWDQQQDYKKRIYGPIASVTFLEGNKGLAPGLELAWAF